MVPSDFETFYEIRKVLAKDLPPVENSEQYERWIHDEMKAYWDAAQQALVQDMAPKDEFWEYDERDYQNQISDLEDEVDELQKKLSKIHSLSEYYD